MLRDSLSPKPPPSRFALRRDSPKPEPAVERAGRRRRLSPEPFCVRLKESQLARRSPASACFARYGVASPRRRGLLRHSSPVTKVGGERRREESPNSEGQCAG